MSRCFLALELFGDFDHVRCVVDEILNTLDYTVLDHVGIGIKVDEVSDSD